MSMNPLNVHLEHCIRGLCSDIFLLTVCYIFRTQILAVQMVVEADAQLVCSTRSAEREKSNVLNMEVPQSQFSPPRF